MIRTISCCEKNVYTKPPKLITIAAATATDVIGGTVTSSDVDEVAFRSIQNVGNNPCFVAFDSEASPVSFHIILAADSVQNAGGQLECNTQQRVSVYSTAGTTIATLIQHRQGL